MKRVISFVLVAAMLIAMFPVFSTTASAAETATDAVIYADAAFTKQGSEVVVDFYIKNNPGILGMTLKVNYDESKATLTAVENGEALPHMTFTTPKKLGNGCSLPWDAQDVTEEDIRDGRIVRLTFMVAASAKVNDIIDIALSYDAGAVIDGDMNPISVRLESGSIWVLDYTPGDTNNNGLVDSTDVVFLRRHIAGGYNVTIKEEAGDVNDDGLRNTTDVVYIRRYTAGGYGVILLPSRPKCQHTMEEIPYNAATCEEDGNLSYYHCTTCDKYFNDNSGSKEISLSSTVIYRTGHTVVTIPAVPPTDTEGGWTEGSRCSECTKILKEPVWIDPPPSDSFVITYVLAESDAYLLSLANQGKITNTNVTSAKAGTTVTLVKPVAAGYEFLGWYDVTGSIVGKIENIDSNVILYAKWKKEEYKVQYNSPLVPKSADTYTVNTGLPLSAPDMLPGYLFIGWSDADGKVIKEIPVGSTGNITLYGNWTSARNQTRPNTNIGDPLIHFDEENYQIHFAYEIGTVENIPLVELEYIGNVAVPGTNIEKTIKRGITIDESSAEEISNAVSKATTNSAAWTLSEEWTSKTEISEEHLHELDASVASNREAAYSNSGTFNVSTNKGGSTTTAVEAGVSAKVGSSTEVKASFPLEVMDLSAKSEVSAEVGADLTTSESDTKTWNINKGYSASQEASYKTSVSQSLSEKISNSTSYSVSKAATKGASNTQSTAETSTEAREYASAFTYGTSQFEEQTYTVSMNNAPVGYYRMVAAGKAHVFAVVTYDIANRTYGTFTYSIMEDTVRSFLDYSKDTSTFDDNENGVLPFEIPYFVNNYVDSIVGASDGLVVDQDTGVVLSYTGTDKAVFIPQYLPVDDGDGEPAVVKITGIASNAFAGNTELLAVQLCKNITSIPDNAFNGCTSLKRVYAPSVTSIGKNAFAGCTNLEDYTVSERLSTMGTNAFQNVNNLSVMASNAAVVEAAINSGAKNISVNLKNLSGGLANKTLNIPATTESFAFIGNGGTYENVQINSDAQVTEINNMTLHHNSASPLISSSANVKLNRLTLNAPGIVMKLTADNVNVGLYGTVNVNSAGAHAAVCNNAVFSWSNSGVSGKLILDGNLLVSGSAVQGESNISFTNGEIIYIDSENPVIVTFDAAGGSVTETSRLVYGGTVLGELPVPRRDYYTFNGWYTSAEGGDQVTADTLVATDMNVYAHWTQNAESDWVKASQLPEGAEVLGQKWTYTLKTTTESRETSLAGYNQTGSYWVKSGSGSQNYASFPSGFKTSHSIYTSFAKAPYSTSETATTKREVSNNWAGYVYWHWMYNVAYAKNMERQISDVYKEGSGLSFVYFFAMTSSVNCPTASVQGYVTNYASNKAPTTYDCRSILPASTSTTDGMGTPRMLRFDYYTSTYTDYYKMFQYEKFENKESTTQVTASNTISNVQKWVRYRAK